MQNLIEAKKVLNGLRIMWWLDCGTLLFAVRNGVQDPSDDDAGIYVSDVGIIANNLPKFIKKGFRIHNVYHHPDLGITEFSFRREGRAFDIFVYYPSGKYMYGVSWYDKYLYRKLPRVNSTGKIGGNYPIPAEAEKYLSKYYGEDWQTPKPDWNPITDPPCHCEFFKKVK